MNMDEIIAYLKGKYNPGDTGTDLQNKIMPSSPSFDVGVSDTTVPMAGKIEGSDIPGSMPPIPPLPDASANFDFTKDLGIPSPAPANEPIAPIEEPSAALPPKVAPVAPSTPKDEPALPSPLAASPNDEEARKAALADLDKNKGRNALTEFGAGIGDAISASASAFGANAPGGYQKRLQEKHEKEMTSGKTDVDTKILNDPNSDVSKAYRQMVLQIAPEMAKQSSFNNMSAKMIGDKLPLVDTMMKAQAQKDAKELGVKQLNQNREYSMGLKESQQQDKLEKEGRDMINKVVSSRSGGLGLEDQKVNQAIHLQSMLNDAYDPKTKSYVIPPSMHTELAMGLQRLMSPTGAGSTQLTEELRQKTAREGLAGALIYMGFDPKEIGGTTQSVSNFFANAVKRQGLTSEKNRDTYVDQFKSRMPTGLSEERKKYLLDQEVGNSYSKSLPDRQKEGTVAKGTSKEAPAGQRKSPGGFSYSVGN